jgi:hypothetical protein
MAKPTKSPKEVQAIEDALVNVLDDFVDHGAYPYKKDVAHELREMGFRITTTHLGYGVKWAKRLAKLCTYAQQLAIARGIIPEEIRGASIARAA